MISRFPVKQKRAKATAEHMKVLTLPVAMRDSQMLLKLLRLQMQTDSPRRRYRKREWRRSPRGRAQRKVVFFCRYRPIRKNWS